MRKTPREVSSVLDKASFRLNKTQKSVLVGTLLGDGGIRYRGKECRLHIKHSINQLPFVDYKREVFCNITSMEVRKFSQTFGKKDYVFAEFVTLTHSEFTKYYRLFYPFLKKQVPNNIDTLLVDPLSLAVWFMDDGSAEYAGASLQTHSFTKKDVESLINCIRENFNIDASKRLNKGRWIIYFPKASMSRLREVIEKYMLKEFMYKLEPYSVRKSLTP
jgi:hypothetical protein